MGRCGKTREQRQVDWLRSSGIPFWTNARGIPIIARTAINGTQQDREPAQRKWQPKVLASR
nr:DUF4224 domain-containing protein [Paraburkholderia ultramafica]